VRFATPEDFEWVRTLTTEFNEALYDVPVDPEKFRSWYDLHMATGVVILGARSFISALILPDPTRDWLIALETGWYATDRSGARLLLKLIKYAREVGADELRATTLDTSPQEARDVLTRLGFEMDKECSHRLKL
jgi:GNAT superfamily N-acetyltransferase